jgi:hypothetical protein
MPTHELDPRDYLAAPAHSFWRWEEHGDVIAWADGTTIAFRAELAVVLSRLRSQTLPPLGAIVLLLAACRDSWSDTPNKLGILSGLLDPSAANFPATLLMRVGAGLDRIGALSPELRNSSARKAELAAMVFETEGSETSPAIYERLLESLGAGLDELHCAPWTKLDAETRLRRELGWLDRGLARVDRQTLEARLRTGFESDVVPASVELPTAAGSARSLIDELKDDPELGGTTRLARMLLGVVQLPTPVSQPQELPVGGISDIGNRGTLDRLLISELALDSLTLAARLANNEALYLRRETPPRRPSRRRLVLIDAGLRMWGVPRVFAAAVGLALAATADARLAVDVYRTDDRDAQGRKIVPVDLSRKAGLVDLLAALDHRAHPGAALAGFRQQVDAAQGAHDVVLITSQDVLADPAFQLALAEAGFPELHLATVERDGRLQLHLKTLRGRKLLREAQLNLDEVLRPGSKPALPLLDTSRSGSAAAIFRVSPFPLLLSSNVDATRSWHVADFGALTYTRDGRLLHWQTPGRGARQLAEDLPAGNLHWAAPQTVGGRALAVIGKLSDRGLYNLSLDIASGDCRAARLDTELEQPQGVFGHNDTVFVITAKQIHAFSAGTGQLLSSAPLNARRHGRGRFFYSQAKQQVWKDWSAVAFDGKSIRFDLIFSEQTYERRLVDLFEAVGREGAVGVTGEGQLVAVASNTLRNVHYPGPVPSPAHVEAVARDGWNVLICATRTPDDRRSVNAVVDVRTLLVTACPGRLNYSLKLEPLLHATARPAVLRHRFQGIGVDPEGRLLLVQRRGMIWPLKFDERDDIVRLKSADYHQLPGVWRHFETLQTSRENRFDLSQAVFADGSRAILDARGLLHLKSSDPSLPECTIVLAEKSMAGWTSHGLWWGSEYFIGDHKPTSPTTIRDTVVRSIVELLR